MEGAGEDGAACPTGKGKTAVISAGRLPRTGPEGGGPMGSSTGSNPRPPGWRAGSPAPTRRFCIAQEKLRFVVHGKDVDAPTLGLPERLEQHQVASNAFVHDIKRPAAIWRNR